MNCTNEHNQTGALEISPLKARCNRMAIHVPGDNPTPAQIIPIIEQRLAAHQKHIAKTCNPWTGDFIEWKNINDAYQEFLTDLRAAQATKSITPIPPIAPVPSATPPAPLFHKISHLKPGQNPSKNPQSPHPQETTTQNQTRTEPGPNPDNAGLTRTEPESTRTKAEQTRIESDQSAQSSACPDPEPAPQPDQEDEDVPKIQSNDQDFVEAATHLHLHLKRRSRFDKLPPEHQAAVIHLMDHCKTEAVLKVIAQPPPIGFSLKAGRTALYEFRDRYTKREAERRRNENIAANVQLLSKSGDPNKTFVQTFEHIIQVRALTAAGQPITSLATLDAFATTLTKIRKQSLAERKQEHAEKNQTQKQ